MAPMIDVVFLLIIFFVLVSTFASAERVPMELPDPDASQAKNVKLTNRVIINVQPADPAATDGAGVSYSLGAVHVDSLGEISERLARYSREVPNLKVVIRADRRLRYGAVREVMEVVAENGIENMNIVAHVGDAGESP
jgi:biopolymer transport protein ExbD